MLFARAFGPWGLTNLVSILIFLYINICRKLFIICCAIYLSVYLSTCILLSIILTGGVGRPSLPLRSLTCVSSMVRVTRDYRLDCIIHAVFYF